MSARDAILGRVRAALAGEPESGTPPSYELWPAGTWRQPNDLFECFRDELQRVQGEGHRFSSVAEARRFLQELHQSLGSPITAVFEHPVCHSVVEGLPADRVRAVEPAADRTQLALIPLAVMPAEFLLADTGTAVVLPHSHAERLACYLPTVAVLVARPESVVAHLSNIWDRMTALAMDPAERGEMVLVTGPSRTADIEKKLVLGAHGPKRLVVILLEDRSISRG